MFVLSIRASRLKWWALAGAGLLSAVLLLFSAFRPSQSLSASATAAYPGGTDAQRREFLARYGWEVSEDPTEICEILIPQVFDETYHAYNELQISQGFDLTPYRGKRVKKWVYRVENYPNATEEVYATLLIRDNIILGGDLSSERADGFQQGFRPDAAPTTSGTA